MDAVGAEHGDVDPRMQATPAVAELRLEPAAERQRERAWGLTCEGSHAQSLPAGIGGLGESGRD